jgi:hypothetical protein
MPKPKRSKVARTNVPKPPRPNQRVSLEARIVLEHLAEPWDQPSLSKVESAERRWVCELWWFNVGCEEPCFRCRKPCQWTTETRIFPRGQISHTTVQAPLCPCPDGHIREAIAKAVANALVKDSLERSGGTNTSGPGD